MLLGELSERYSLVDQCPWAWKFLLSCSGRSYLPERRSKSLSFIKQVEYEAGRIALHWNTWRIHRNGGCTVLFQCLWQIGVLGCDAFEFPSERLWWIVWAYWSTDVRVLRDWSSYSRGGVFFSGVVQLFFAILLPSCVICWPRRGLESEECGFLPDWGGRGEEV